MKMTTLTLAVLTSVILASCCSQEYSAPPLRPMPRFQEAPMVIQNTAVEEIPVEITK